MKQKKNRKKAIEIVENIDEWLEEENPYPLLDHDELIENLEEYDAELGRSIKKKNTVQYLDLELRSRDRKVGIDPITGEEYKLGERRMSIL